MKLTLDHRRELCEPCSARLVHELADLFLLIWKVGAQGVTAGVRQVLRHEQYTTATETCDLCLERFQAAGYLPRPLPDELARARVLRRSLGNRPELTDASGAIAK